MCFDSHYITVGKLNGSGLPTVIYNIGSPQGKDSAFFCD